MSNVPGQKGCRVLLVQSRGQVKVLNAADGSLVASRDDTIVLVSLLTICQLHKANLHCSTYPCHLIFSGLHVGVYSGVLLCTIVELYYGVYIPHLRQLLERLV
jgi:hypothetical protein